MCSSLRPLVLLLPDQSHTALLGELLARALEAQSAPGSEIGAVYLTGDLGSGKTTLARSLVAALPGGQEAEVASPTFTLCNEYPTTPPVLHGDLYRLGAGTRLPEELEDAMIQGALLLLEWAEYLDTRDCPPDRLEIALMKPDVHGGFPAGLAQGALSLDPGSVRATVENLDFPEQSCERKRLAVIAGYGNGGEALLAALRRLAKPHRDEGAP